MGSRFQLVNGVKQRLIWNKIQSLSMSLPEPQVQPSGSTLPPPQALPTAKEIPDYYGILGVEKAASWDEIRRSYRKLAFKWHPDKNMHQQDFAEKEFQKIAEAYEVLSDDEMRKIYDEGGSLAEACCKRKYQQSNEVGEDDEEGNFFRDPSQMYAEAFGFGAGACVAGCCGSGQGMDPFAQLRQYGIIPNGVPHDYSGHDHEHDDDSEDYDSEDYDSEDYGSEDDEDVDEEQSVKGDPDEGENDDEDEDTNKGENEDDGEPQTKKRKTEGGDDQQYTKTD